MKLLVFKNIESETRIIYNDFWDVLWYFEILILCELSTASLQSSTGYSRLQTGSATLAKNKYSKSGNVPKVIVGTR